MLLAKQGLVETKTDQPRTNSIEVLQQILIEQGQREIAYSEAKEIGDSLIEFYQTLAEEVQDESAD